MNLSLWTSIREYVDAEIKLAIARYDYHVHAMTPKRGEQIAALEEQSTRMETAVREMLPASASGEQT